MIVQLRRLGQQPYQAPDVWRLTENGDVLLCGRGTACQVYTKSKFASRKHFQIAYTREEFIIKDLNSANGTYVNNEKLESEKILCFGDIISVGVPLNLKDEPECVVYVFEDQANPENIKNNANNENAPPTNENSKNENPPLNNIDTAQPNRPNNISDNSSSSVSSLPNGIGLQDRLVNKNDNNDNKKANKKVAATIVQTAKTNGAVGSNKNSEAKITSSDVGAAIRDAKRKTEILKPPNLVTETPKRNEATNRTKTSEEVTNLPSRVAETLLRMPNSKKVDKTKKLQTKIEETPKQNSAIGSNKKAEATKIPGSSGETPKSPKVPNKNDTEAAEQVEKLVWNKKAEVTKSPTRTESASKPAELPNLVEKREVAKFSGKITEISKQLDEPDENTKDEVMKSPQRTEESPKSSGLKKVDSVRRSVEVAEATRRTDKPDKTQKAEVTKPLTRITETRKSSDCNKRADAKSSRNLTDSTDRVDVPNKIQNSEVVKLSANSAEAAGRVNTPKIHITEVMNAATRVTETSKSSNYNKKVETMKSTVELTSASDQVDGSSKAQNAEVTKSLNRITETSNSSDEKTDVMKSSAKATDTRRVENLNKAEIGEVTKSSAKLADATIRTETPKAETSEVMKFPTRTEETTKSDSNKKSDVSKSSAKATDTSRVTDTPNKAESGEAVKSPAKSADANKKIDTSKTQSSEIMKSTRTDETTKSSDTSKKLDALKSFVKALEQSKRTDKSIMCDKVEAMKSPTRLRESSKSSVKIAETPKRATLNKAENSEELSSPSRVAVTSKLSNSMKSAMETSRRMDAPDKTPKVEVMKTRTRISETPNLSDKKTEVAKTTGKIVEASKLRGDKIEAVKTTAKTSESPTSSDKRRLSDAGKVKKESDVEIFTRNKNSASGNKNGSLNSSVNIEKDVEVSESMNYDKNDAKKPRMSSVERMEVNELHDVPEKELNCAENDMFSSEMLRPSDESENRSPTDKEAYDAFTQIDHIKTETIERENSGYSVFEELIEISDSDEETENSSQWSQPAPELQLVKSEGENGYDDEIFIDDDYEDDVIFIESVKAPITIKIEEEDEEFTEIDKKWREKISKSQEFIVHSQSQRKSSPDSDDVDASTEVNGKRDGEWRRLASRDMDEIEEIVNRRGSVDDELDSAPSEIESVNKATASLTKSSSLPRDATSADKSSVVVKEKEFTSSIENFQTKTERSSQREVEQTVMDKSAIRHEEVAIPGPSWSSLDIQRKGYSPVTSDEECEPMAVDYEDISESSEAEDDEESVEAVDDEETSESSDEEVEVRKRKHIEITPCSVILQRLPASVVENIQGRRSPERSPAKVIRRESPRQQVSVSPTRKSELMKLFRPSRLTRKSNGETKSSRPVTKPQKRILDGSEKDRSDDDDEGVFVPKKPKIASAPSSAKSYIKDGSLLPARTILVIPPKGIRKRKKSKETGNVQLSPESRKKLISERKDRLKALSLKKKEENEKKDDTTQMKKNASVKVKNSFKTRGEFLCANGNVENRAPNAVSKNEESQKILPSKFGMAQPLKTSDGLKAIDSSRVKYPLPEKVSTQNKSKEIDQPSKIQDTGKSFEEELFSADSAIPQKSTEISEIRKSAEISEIRKFTASFYRSEPREYKIGNHKENQTETETATDVAARNGNAEEFLDVPEDESSNEGRAFSGEEEEAQLKSCLKKNNQPSRPSRRIRFSDNLEQIKYFEKDNVKEMRKFGTKRPPVPKQKSIQDGEMRYKQIIFEICNWNALWLEECKKMADDQLPPVFKLEEMDFIQKKFPSHHHYMEQFIPLLLMELWISISKNWKAIGNTLPKYWVACSSYEDAPESDTSNLSICVIEGVFPTNEQQIREGALVMIKLHQQCANPDADPSSQEMARKMGYYVFGFVESKNFEKITRETRSAAPIQATVDRFKGMRLNSYLFKLRVYVKKRPHLRIDFGKLMQLTAIQYIAPELRLFKAVCSLPKSPLCDTILSPNRPDLLKINNSWKKVKVIFNEPLDAAQQEIVQKVSSSCFSSDPSLFLIRGGAGTGKTHVALAIIVQLLLGEKPKDFTRPKVIYCASSNVAVDEVAFKLKSYRQSLGGASRYKLVRVGNPNMMRSDVIDISSLHLAIRNEFREKNNEELSAVDAKIKSLVAMMEKPDKNFGKNIEDEMSFNLSKHVRFKKLLQNRVPDMNVQPSNQAESSIIKNADVICTTCSSSGTQRMMNIFNSITSNQRNQRIVCIVDEAMQSKEAETIVPLLLGVKNLVLIGDPYQLRSCVKSEKAHEKGINQSLFWRILSHFKNTKENLSPIQTLKTQYRMYPSIAEFPNKKFYDNQLKDASETTKFKLTRLKPYVVILDKEEEEVSADERNVREATVVRLILQAVLSLIEREDKTCTVGVIASNKIQLGNIRKQMPENEFRDLEVNLVDKYQGRQTNIVIFVNDGTMLSSSEVNVALTRARDSLIVVLLHQKFNDNAIKNDVLTKLVKDAKHRGLVRYISNSLSLQEAASVIS